MVRSVVTTSKPTTSADAAAPVDGPAPAARCRRPADRRRRARRGCLDRRHVRGVLIDVPTAETTADEILRRSWQLSPELALRPESFGALAYHFGTRRLSFLKSPQLVAVVRSLADHPTALDACRAAGVADGDLDRYGDVCGRSPAPGRSSRAHHRPRSPRRPTGPRRPPGRQTRLWRPHQRPARAGWSSGSSPAWPRPSA